MRRKLMEEKLNASEQEFLRWLPSAVFPYLLAEIKTLYFDINNLLIQSGALSQPLMSVTTVEEIENALRTIKESSSSKRLRAAAINMLNAYIKYLPEKKNIASAEHNNTDLESFNGFTSEGEFAEHNDTDVEIQQDWIYFDFTNAQDFERTIPAYCSIDGQLIEGKTWSQILVNITEQEISRNNPALSDLYKTPLMAQSKEQHPYLMKNSLAKQSCSQLSNGYWLNRNFSLPKLMERIKALCLHCGYRKEQIYIYGASKEKASYPKRRSTISQSSCSVPIEKLEEYLLKANLQGATVKELIDAIQPGATVSSTTKALDESLSVIRMPENRFVHIDSFVDLDEAEEKLSQILKTHFAQFGGYSNNQLLFGAASQELSMFLNDNNCENIDAVYAIARFLFEKRVTSGKPYKFSVPHIFETEPNYPMTLHGLMINLARTYGGVLQADIAKQYLQKAKLTYSSIGYLLQIGSTHTFLLYDSDQYILSEKLGIDDAWCNKMHDRMDELFRKANVAYVIPRDISTTWLETLPPLPNNLEWTHLLLQEILNKYPAIGFKSISSDLNQTYDTLAAAFVPMESPLQSFPDIVTIFMEEHHNLPKRMDGEELRIELRDAGMIEGNEMINALPKALDDYRFAWSNENKTVLVRGN